MCVCVRVCVCACVCLCEVKTRNLIIAQQAELIGFIQLLPPQLGSVDKQILFEHVTPYAPNDLVSQTLPHISVRELERCPLDPHWQHMYSHRPLY